MRVLLAEDNLMFSARMGSVLRQAGYEVEVCSRDLPADLGVYGAAVLNLGAKAFDVSEAAARVKAAGIPLVGHAGGSETHLWELGKEIGCDKLVRNSNAMADIAAAVKDLCGA